jgi:hypothetical protein
VHGSRHDHRIDFGLIRKDSVDESVRMGKVSGWCMVKDIQVGLAYDIGGKRIRSLSLGFRHYFDHVPHALTGHDRHDQDKRSWSLTVDLEANARGSPEPMRFFFVLGEDF